MYPSDVCQLLVERRAVSCSELGVREFVDHRHPHSSQGGTPGPDDSTVLYRALRTRIGRGGRSSTLPIPLLLACLRGLALWKSTSREPLGRLRSSICAVVMQARGSCGRQGSAARPNSAARTAKYSKLNGHLKEFY
jgi:hypothetical protein